MMIALFDTDNWKEITATLARNKTRTFLTGFGIFWGVAILAILLGGARGARDLLYRNFDGFASNSAMVFTYPTSKPYGGFEKGRTWNMTTHDTQMLREAFPFLTAVTEMIQVSGISFGSEKQSQSGQLTGVDTDYDKVMLPTIYSGRFINDADIAQERKVAAVGKQVAERLYPGEPNVVGKDIRIGGIVFTIVGTIGQTNGVQMGGKIDEQVMIPSSTFRRAYNQGDKVHGLLFVADDNTRISNIIPLMHRMISKAHSIDPTDEQAVHIFDISEKFEMLDKLFAGISLLALFIGISTLLAGVIGIGNIMWVIVKERTQEIGIRRAIGAIPADITSQILTEGLALTTVAGLAGISFAVIALGITQVATATDYSTPRFQMSLGQALLIFAVFAILGILAGLIPARKAMKIKPVEAINDK